MNVAVNMKDFKDPAEILLKIFEQKKKKNVHYSIRAFARNTGMSASHLFGILNRKKYISRKNGYTIAEKLEFSNEQRNYFLEIVEKQNIARSNLSEKTIEDVKTLDHEQFNMVSKWYYFALLSLIETSDFSSDNKWIAKRLGLTEQEVELAIRNLKAVGIVEEKDGKIITKQDFVATQTDIPSSVIRQFHRENLERAEQTLETFDVQKRDFSSITFSFNPQKMEQVKKLIKGFRRNLAELMETGDRSEVYTLAIQFFPVSQRGE